MSLTLKRNMLKNISEVVRRFVYCFVTCRQGKSPWVKWFEQVSLGLLLAFSSTSFATDISGPITTSARWTVANSPYVVTADVEVTNSAIITIDAGVVVYMKPGTSIYVRNGAVKATGTAQDPIRVLSEKQQLQLPAFPGDWKHWVFESASNISILEHVHFEYGSGIKVIAAAPIFNFVSIRYQQGPAIAVDLHSSLSGVGNSAADNAINAVVVPAGDVLGTIRWGLRGIPYLIQSGSVSVGQSPAILRVEPNQVEQGETVTLKVIGTRLDGVAQVAVDKSGLAVTPFSGGNSSQSYVQLKADPSAALGNVLLDMLVDAGQVRLADAFSVTAPKPALDALSPTKVITGSGVTELSITGRKFTSDAEVTVNAAVIPTTFISVTQLSATLPNQAVASNLIVQIRRPNAQRPGEYLLSNTMPLEVEKAVPPTVTIEPNPLALPPDNKTRDIVIRLSKVDSVDHIINLSVSDAAKLSVAPTSITIPAGQTTTKVAVTPKVSGTAILTLDSATLNRVQFPVFITTDYRGASTAFAQPVGVVIPSSSSAELVPSTLHHNVGVSVGGVLTAVSPSAWLAGDNPIVKISGHAIPANAQLTIVPADNIAIAAVTVNAEQTELSAQLNISATAQLGYRKLIVRDQAGKEIVFADPKLAVAQIFAGQPLVESVSPNYLRRGMTTSVTIRGRHLHQGYLRIAPEAGVRIDATPTISGDGTMLIAQVEVLADAVSGARLIQVVTPAGTSSAELSAANTLTIASQVGLQYSPIASSLVGVKVGEVVTEPETAPIQPLSSPVGVVVGASIKEVSPNIAVIGTDTTITVRGSGLNTVDAITIKPATAISFVGDKTVNAEGTELSFVVRVEGNAALGYRQLTLSSAGKPIPAARIADQSILISAPIPVLNSVSPQIVLTGQSSIAMTVRGRNLDNVESIRLEPAQGATVSGPYLSSPNGDQVTFYLSLAANAVSGERAVIVKTVAGESIADLHAGNMLRVASQVGATYAGISSAQIGVLNGPVIEPTPVLSNIHSVGVGVVVGSVDPAPEQMELPAISPLVGLVVGSAVSAQQPDGWLQGSAGTLTVSGKELSATTQIKILPVDGVLLGDVTVAGDAESLTVPITVAPNATPGKRRVVLTDTNNKPVPFISVEQQVMGIGVMPVLNSVAPINLQQGKGVTLQIRGSNLQWVSQLIVEGAPGISVATDMQWSQDGLGELLTVSITADSNAALGSRVIRLVVPGGITSGEAVPANTINVITPQ